MAAVKLVLQPLPLKCSQKRTICVIAEQAAEKPLRGMHPDLSGWSRYWKQAVYRSGKPLRHPKSSTASTFSASC